MSTLCYIVADTGKLCYRDYVQFTKLTSNSKVMTVLYECISRWDNRSLQSYIVDINKASTIKVLKNLAKVTKGTITVVVDGDELEEESKHCEVIKHLKDFYLSPEYHLRLSCKEAGLNYNMVRRVMPDNFKSMSEVEIKRVVEFIRKWEDAKRDKKILYNT